MAAVRATIAPEPSPLDVYLAILKWTGHRGEFSGEAKERILRAGLPFVRELRLKRIDSLLYLSCSHNDVAQRVYDKVWALQRDAAVKLLQEFDAQGVFAVVIKGAEVINRYFSPHSLTFLNDVDILVSPDNIQAAKRLLYANGYAQHLFDRERQALLPRDVREIASIEAGHYELAPFNRLQEIELTVEEGAFVREWDWHPIWAIGERFFAVVEFDIHYAVAFDVGGEEFFPRCIASSFGFGKAMSRADQLWFIASRFYNEVGSSGKAALRDIAYITALLTDGSIDWDVVVDIAHRYDLRPSLYYYLAFSNWLVGGSALPPGVLTALRPSLGSRQRDWGWQIAKLLGSDEAFSDAAVGEFSKN